MKHVTNLSAEPITAELRACLEQVANLPGARIVKRRGHLFLQSGRFEILAERLCALKTRWCALVEHAPIADEDKWRIFALLMANHDARLEHVPGVGLKVTLPPRPRH